MTQFQLKLIELEPKTARFYIKLDLLVDEITTKLVVKMPFDVPKETLHSRYHKLDDVSCFPDYECRKYWRPKNVQDAIKWVKKNISKPRNSVYKKLFQAMLKQDNLYFLEIWE